MSIGKPNKTTNLEEKAWYRILKVIYIVAFILTIGVALLLGYLNKPYSYLDRQKSTVTCILGGTYELNKLDEDTLHFNDNEKATYFCNSIFPYSLSYSPEKQWVWSPKADEWLQNTPDNIEVIKSYYLGRSLLYKINSIYSTQGSWNNVLTRLGITLVVGLLILEAVKRTCLYIIIGK